MLTRRVMPTTRLPNFNESPLFLRGEGGRLTPVAPLGVVCQHTVPLRALSLSRLCYELQTWIPNKEVMQCFRSVVSC